MVKHSVSRSKALVPFLLLLVTTTKQQACDRNNLRLILDHDVAQYTYPAASSCSIYDLLSTRSCTFWCAPASLALPRGIDITFAQPFVLEGISTQGKDNGYISQFTVIYSESSDGPLQSFVDVSLPSADGHFFILPVSIVTQRLHLLMTDTTTSPTSSYFYWHLDLLGCTLVSTNKTAGSPPDTDTDITLVSSPVMAIPSANEGSIVVVSPSTISTPTIDPTIAQSSTISIQMDTNMPSSSSRRKHETVTEIVSSCSVSADVPVEGAVSGNTTAAGLAGAVVPLLIIIMILVTVLIVLLVLIYRKRRNHSRINKPTDVPMISVNQNGDGMRNNLECSVPGENSLPPSNAGAAKLAGIQEGNKIFVDPVYFKIEPNDPTSKYEYKHTSPVGRGEGGDGSTQCGS